MLDSISKKIIKMIIEMANIQKAILRKMTKIKK